MLWCKSKFTKSNVLFQLSKWLSNSSVIENSHPLSRRLKTDVDAVVIGGGAVGVSAAYHLAKYGVKDVVLLEKSELTSGSTWHAAGLITTFQTSINAKKINLYSVNLFNQLEAETGQNVGFHRPGSLRLLNTATRMDEARYHMTRQHWNKAEQHLIGPDKAMELCPLLNPNKILGGLFNAGDGHIDPYSLTQALAIGARQHGASIYQRSPVTGVSLRSDGRWDVSTSHGTLTTTHLINASGFYAAEVCRMCGIDHYVPIVPVHHQYFITAPLPELADPKLPEFPVLRDLDGAYYLRQEKQGLLVGPYEEPSRMDICADWVYGRVPDFEKELFPDNLERIMPNVEKAMEMVPALSKVEVSAVVNGPITYNCQSSPLIGPIQGVPNFWQMAGFGYGIAQSGGAGHFIASWICDGEPPHELIDLDAERYGRWCTKDFAVAKARESYGLNSYPTFPKEERIAGRPSPRCGPLYEQQKQLGAQFGYVSGWEKPVYYAKTETEKNPKLSFRRSNWFSAVDRECQAVLDNVGLADLTPFAKYVVSGTAASIFLDRVTANTLPKVNSTCITHMLTPKGKVFAELTLTHYQNEVKGKPESQYLVVTGAGSEFHDLWWLEEQQRKLGYHGDSAGVSMQNITDKVGVLAVAGPRSRDLLQPITEDADLDSGSWRFLQHRLARVCGIRVHMIRISYTGELGWEMYCDMEQLSELYKRILDHGRSYELASFGAYAMNSLRIEKGFRMWGSDMTVDTDPLEAGLGFFVKSKKPTDFIGKAAIQQLKAQPLPRRLVFLQIDTEDVDADGDESVFLDNEVVGNVTSGSYGFQANCSLAMAYIPTDLAKVGQKLHVELLGNRCPATVSLEPAFKIESMRQPKSS